MLKKIVEFWNVYYSGISKAEIMLVIKVSIFNFIIAGLVLSPLLLIVIFIKHC